MVNDDGSDKCAGESNGSDDYIYFYSYYDRYTASNAIIVGIGILIITGRAIIMIVAVLLLLLFPCCFVIPFFFFFASSSTASTAAAYPATPSPATAPDAAPHSPAVPFSSASSFVFSLSFIPRTSLRPFPGSRAPGQGSGDELQA